MASLEADTKERDKKLARVAEKQAVKHKRDMKDLHRSLGKAAKSREAKRNKFAGKRG